MIRSEAVTSRKLKQEMVSCDLAIVGGGLAGTCCAITAARAGLKVVLIQDRPVLGGNASSEVRLWILGATSHMGNNNRWAREGGVVDEILLENLYRNPEGNPYVLDSILLEKVAEEPNIRLLLNTAVHDLDKQDADHIRSVRAFCAQNSTAYEIAAPLFVDASGDGVLGFMAGAAFRMGVEARSEFGEKMAPELESQDLLGHSIYFYSRDTGRPVRFVPPSFALKDITRIPRYRDFKAGDSGCRLWWLEWGGTLDTVHDTEAIKWELWKVAYGVWNYIKNSGSFPEAENLTLEWVGTIPGKRESRRFEGDYMLTQQDLVEQREHADAVSYGGWAIDLHPVEGVYSSQPGCQQWHSKGVYPIPYRSLYSRNIRNLFLAGRIISASHIAFGSTRVMSTCAHNAQAVAMAAALCLRHRVEPRDVAQAPLVGELQQALLHTGQYIPGVPSLDEMDQARSASISASSELKLGILPAIEETRPLDYATAMMIPVAPGAMPVVSFTVDVLEATELMGELRISSKPGNHTPDVVLKKLSIPVQPGSRIPVAYDFCATIDHACYVFVCLMENPSVQVHLSNHRVTGVLSVSQKFNRAVAKSSRQEPPEGSGVESFEFWLPERRPGGKNLAMTCQPPLGLFQAENVINGWGRPARQPNAWVADWNDRKPWLRLRWDKPQSIRRVELVFDTDFDHPAESVLMGHPERVMPFCVPDVVLIDGRDENKACSLRAGGLACIKDNHQTRRILILDKMLVSDCLEIHLSGSAERIPASLFEVRCYA